MAFAGILGSASAATINFTTSSNALIATYTGDEKKGDKKKDKTKEKCCKKDGKACCKKKEAAKEETKSK